MRTILRLLENILFCALVLFVALGVFYWVGWPRDLRLALAAAAIVVLPLLWFWPGARRKGRRLAAIAALGVFLAAYAVKEPQPRLEVFIPLHRNVADVVWLDSSRFAVENYRDAIHPVGEPALPRWMRKEFDLDALTGGQFVLQPFGASLATVHAMTSFSFANGDHLAVSFEARITEGGGFDAVAGFFKHDQLYAVVGTERDLFWKRLAHVPPNDLYIFDLTPPTDELRAYLRRMLDFIHEIHDRPQFYSTVSESCFSTLIRLSPRVEAAVPWYDLRRWVPGASVTMLQDLGLIDAATPPDRLIRESRLPAGIRPPWEFPDARSWSDYLGQVRARGSGEADGPRRTRVTGLAAGADATADRRRTGETGEDG